MRKILYLIISMPILLLSACDVHEWPETPEFVKLHLRLNYETDMTEWEHLYDGASVIEQGLGETYDNHQDYGKIRYIVRTYPVSEKQRTTSNYTQEFVFTKDIAEGYNHEVTLNVLPGNYNFMVWSDLVQTSGDSHFYNADNFAEITLQGDHKGNTDHRDSFRGSNNITLIADIMERLPDTLNVAMQRPLAKFEFITNDVVEFIDKESTRIASKANENKNKSVDDTPTRAVNIEDYKVVFYYVGFMPHAYSMYTDKPVDLGTIAAYDISPVMMDIYGLEEPLYFQFLNRQLRVASRTNTRGTTMNLDGTTTQEPTEFQQRWCAEHWLLQYDLMFGKGYALQRMGLAGLSGVDTGK